MSSGASFARNVFRTACIYYAFTEHIGCLTLGLGPSMDPALQHGDVMLSERITPRRPCSFCRGDVVCVVDPHDPHRVVVKRIVGLPGEKVKMSGASSHKDFSARTPFMPESQEVPEGHVWLEGDNVAMSRDSREYGPVPMAMILTRNTHVVWPPSRLGRIASRPGV
jgi:signal peptidase I